MEDFIVSARKYRPQTFDTVVGQQMITQTLERAIAQNQMAQAFLFCGPRGVGKTTCARIFARAVNNFDFEEGDTGSAYAFNIFELDGASNNSVDDIRGLIDQVRIPPQIGKYKVYIIDEVHMLSTNAFNAFLKTLEEPPPYAIFILATTEKHKVLPTILSRCQIFDFQRIKITDMVVQLQTIAAKEGIAADADGLHLIAEKADGAMRDALSIFDQIAASSDNKITYQAVIENLNILDYDYYFELLEAFQADDKPRAILTLHKILEKGFDGHHFVNGLANHIRALFFAIDPKTASILEVSENVKNRYLEQARSIDTRFLLNALAILSDADTQYRTSLNTRLLVELALLKLCSLMGKADEKKNASDELSAPQSTPKVEQPKVAPAPITSVEREILATAGTPETPATPDSPAPAQSFIQKEPQRLIEKESEPVALKEAQTPAESVPELGTPVTTASRKEIEEKPSALAEVNEPQESLDFNQPKEAAASHDDLDAAVVPPLVVAPVATSAPVEPEKPAPVAKKITLPDTELRAKLQKSHVAGMMNIRDGQQAKPVPSSVSSVANPTGPVLEEKKPAKDFDLPQLWEAWERYAQQIKGQDRQSYFATLSKHQPIMKEKYQIEYLVDNDVQKSDIDNDRLNLIGFLRDTLDNGEIQLTVIIDDQDHEDGDSLYEPTKKFEAMAKDNPVLETFRRKFDLDVDYDA